MIQLLFSIIVDCHWFLSVLGITSSYEHGSPTMVVNARALCISSETFTCTLLLVTLSVSTGAFFDLLVVATTDRHNSLSVIMSSLNGAWWWDSRVGQWLLSPLTVCLCVLIRSHVRVWVWPMFTPEAGGLWSPCPSVLCPVKWRSEFAPAVAGFPATSRRATWSVGPWDMLSHIPLVSWVRLWAMLSSVPLASPSSVYVPCCGRPNMPILVISFGSSSWTACSHFSDCRHDISAFLSSSNIRSNWAFPVLCSEFQIIHNVLQACM